MALVAVACDPPPGVNKDGSPAENRGAAGADPIADAALGKAHVSVLEDGTIEIYDRYGELRAVIVDPKARFSETMEPITGTKEWTKANPQLSIPLGGLAEWLTKRGQDRRAKAQLESKGLSESQRMMVAIAESAERSEQRLAELDTELAEIWADTSKAAADRRRLIFARWDECEEGDPETVTLRIEDASTAADAIRKHAGERARAVIEAFVRKELPMNGPDAYTHEELTALDEGRTSTRHFRPYPPSPKPSSAVPSPQAPEPAPTSPKP